MKAKIELTNSLGKEIINVENIIDRNHFFYEDNDNARNEVSIFDNGIDIKRNSNTHSTFLSLRENENSFVSITSREGNLIFNAKVLELNTNNDIITLVYKVEEDTNSIIINYLGV